MNKPAQIHVSERPKEQRGWREGRPLEDPAKTKRWGFVQAKPSEFLVHVHRGAVRTKSSGQGAVCFKLPWDSVAVIPTSLQQLRFTADQVTIERVGVEVAGLAVYRIADPLIAYRVLNFSFPERAQEKLEETLTSMFVGAARRLIANLTLDDCLQKRKFALADELLREVAPVVGGEGRLDDTTAQGWGIVIDTIEIQEVRVQSDSVFKQLQAPYRTGLERRSEEARIQSQLAIAAKKQELERQRIVDDAALAQSRAQAALEAREAETERKLKLEELRRKEAEAEIASVAILVEAAQKRAELDRATLTSTSDARRAEAELKRVEGEASAAVAHAHALVKLKTAEADARLKLAEKLPELASAVGANVGELKVVHVGGDASSALGAVTGAVQSIVDLVKRA
jgi:hypothetical protein